MNYFQASKREPGQWEYETPLREDKSAIEIAVYFMKGNRPGVYVSAVPWNYYDEDRGGRTCSISKITSVLVRSLPRKSQRDVTDIAVAIDEFAPEVAKAFESGKLRFRFALAEICVKYGIQSNFTITDVTPITEVAANA